MDKDNLNEDLEKENIEITSSSRIKSDDEVGEVVAGIPVAGEDVLGEDDELETSKLDLPDHVDEEELL